MRTNARALRMVLETADVAGIPRARLLEGIADAEGLTRAPVEWETLVLVLERLSRELGDDPERVRDFGGRMSRAPSYELLQRLARQLLPLRTVFEVGHRLVAPTLFPHAPLSMTFMDERRVRFRGHLPSSALGSLPFFWIFEGIVREVPRLLGMPRATLLASEVGPHHVDCVLELPAQPSLATRARRALHSIAHAREIRAALEAHQADVDAGLHELTRATYELREVLERLPDLVAIHRDGVILWVNRALAKTLGYDDTDALVGRHLRIIVHESSQGLLFDRLRRPPTGEGLPPATEVRLVRRDGEALVVEVAPAQVVTFGGRPARLVAARDVSERVRLQQRLVTSDRLAALGTLAAAVAHEINNPLAYAMASVEIAARDEGKSDDDARARVRQALATALEGLGRVRSIVRDMRRLSRVEDDALGAVDVRLVVESTLGLAGNELARRAKVVREYGAAPPARASEARLGQVLLNLVVNAMEAIPEGAPEDHEIRVRTGVDDSGRVLIEVSDTGAGMPPEVAARVFDPFFTTKPVGRGTGLGLSICHRIVTDFGGTIDVRSSPGRGTTFRVLLPAAAAEARDDARPRGTEAPSSGVRSSARVLVVDDERRLLDAIGSILSDHDVVLTTSADAALAAIEADDRFDLVLCDVMMPGKSGLDLFAAMRASLRERVVFMTGGAFTAEARAALEATGRPRLDKPFGATTLLRTLDAAMARSSSRALG